MCGASRINMQPNTTYIISPQIFPNFLTYRIDTSTLSMYSKNQHFKSNPNYHKKPSYIIFHSNFIIQNLAFLLLTVHCFVPQSPILHSGEACSNRLTFQPSNSLIYKPPVTSHCCKAAQSPVINVIKCYQNVTS